MLVVAFLAVYVFGVAIGFYWAANAHNCPAKRSNPIAEVDAAYMSAKQKMLDADIQRRYQKARR